MAVFDRNVFFSYGIRHTSKTINLRCLVHQDAKTIIPRAVSIPLTLDEVPRSKSVRIPSSNYRGVRRSEMFRKVDVGVDEKEWPSERAEAEVEKCSEQLSKLLRKTLTAIKLMSRSLYSLRPSRCEMTLHPIVFLLLFLKVKPLNTMNSLRMESEGGFAPMSNQSS